MPIILHAHDIRGGRGNGPNTHPGNIYFRDIVAAHQDIYMLSSHRSKEIIALNIITDIERRSPPGRFLSKDRVTGTWALMDKDKKIRKTKQALRELKSTKCAKECNNTSLVRPNESHVTIDDPMDIDNNQYSQIETNQTAMRQAVAENNEHYTTETRTTAISQSHLARIPTYIRNSTISHNRLYETFLRMVRQDHSQESSRTLSCSSLGDGEIQFDRIDQPPDFETELDEQVRTDNKMNKLNQSNQIDRPPHFWTMSGRDVTAFMQE